jgi:hypothetical protein
MSQGPSGTGKTHTIANLIGRLVGHGKRDPVTSQQALLVPRDKSPQSIRGPSAAMPGSSAASLPWCGRRAQKAEKL